MLQGHAMNWNFIFEAVVQNGKTTLENCLTVLIKLNMYLLHNPAIPHLDVYPQRKENKYSSEIY
jgi:hypothetical protein